MNREEQLSFVVKYTQEWLEETGCIAVVHRGRKSCHSRVDSKKSAILDILCERAIKGTLTDYTADELNEQMAMFNCREYLSNALQAHSHSSEEK